MFKTAMLLGLLALATAAGGCSVGTAGRARLTGLPNAKPHRSNPTPAVMLPDPEDLYLGLTPINRAVYGWQLNSLRAVAESLGARFEIHRLTPSDVGSTFVWDSTAARYTRSLRSDAPVGAIRLVLYRIDEDTDLPVLPLTEIGTIDLYPQNLLIGARESARMRYVVSAIMPDPTIYADFTAVEGAPKCACARLAGWVSDGVTRLDFSGTYVIRDEAVARFALTVRGPSQPGKLELTATVEPAQLHAEARFKFHGDSIQARGLLMWEEAATPEGAFAVKVNGLAFADADRDAHTVMGPQGRGLTSAELLATRQLYDLAYGLLLNVELPTYLTFNCGCGQ